MFNPQQFALNMLTQNSNLKNNQMALQAIDILQRNDERAGIEMANNLCQTYGITKEDALGRAKQFFNIR